VIWKLLATLVKMNRNMRILVLADIHSNWPALAAIREPFDACLFLGDLVDYSTNPVPCIEWMREHSTAAIRGNHDHAVAQKVPVRNNSGLARLAAATRPIHWDLLVPSQIKYLARLPVTRRIILDGMSFYLVHATPRDPFDEYLKDDSAAWAERLESVDADFVCVGHTHIPYQVELDSVTVINPGSVGQPRDGDPRCAYVIIENGKVQFQRVEYDIDATLRQMKQSGVEQSVLELAESILTSGGHFDVNKS
jgi:putative phosphoesterase